MTKTYPVLGHSMRFLLEPGDSALALPCPAGELRAGEVALLVKWAGGRPAGYVIHRVLLNARAGGRRLLLTKGDANFLPDLPPSAFQPVARITRISRAGRAWSAAPGRAWPLAAAYSFAAGKLLSWAVHCVYFLFAAAVVCLPRSFAALLNALYLRWEAGLYPAAVRKLAAAVRPAAGAAGAGAAEVKSGRITADETWSGGIIVADYLTIERGAAVSVLPGTTITFERREPWFFPVLRSGAGGALRELDSASAKLLVYGRFSARGRADAPVIFKGPSFGGIHALGGGAAALAGCRLEGAAATALSARDDALLEAVNCDFRACRLGIELSGRARLAARNCAVSGSGGPGLRVLDAAAAAVCGGALTGGAGPAVEVSGRAFAGLSGTAMEGCAAGVSAAGAARVFLKNCGLKKNSGYGAELSGAAFLSAEACVFAGNAAGLFAGDSASLRLKNCLFEGQPGPAAAFCGRARAELAGCASSGAGAGFLFSDGCAGKVAGCAFAHGAAPALTVRGRAVVSVSDSACAGGPSALLLDGGSASLLKVKISGTPFPGIVCGDWRRLAAAEVTYEGRPWLKPAAAGAPARPGRLFLFAAATARLPGFSALYRLFYLAAVPAARRLLDVPGVRALYLYRGMAAKGWVAGLSDMDLACVLRPAAPRGEYEVYCALRRRLRLLKRLFPFTGEVLLAQAPEFAAFLGSWGVKGAEFSAASRLLYGAAVELKPAPAAAGTADLTEAFYAYTLLTRHFLAADLPEAFGRRNCLKNLVDIKRYLAPPAPERASRRAYARLLGLPLEDFMAVSRGEAAYGAFQALHQAAAGADGQILLEPGPEAAAGWFNRPAFDAACRGLAEECGVRPGVVLDSLYRVYLVLPDAAAGDRALFLRACAALGRLRAASPALGASPLVLTRSAFALLCRLPYLNNPAFSLDLRAGGLPGGYRPDDGGVYCYNLVCGGAAPQAAELRAAAVLAARHFCAAWRSLWAEMPPHYFYTRALGLRLLLEKNTALPFSEPERLRAAFPPGGEMPPWSAYCAGGACEANYCFVAAQTAKLGELADAL